MMLDELTQKSDFNASMTDDRAQEWSLTSLETLLQDGGDDYTYHITIILTTVLFAILV